MLKLLRQEKNQFSKTEYLFILGAMLCGFFISADYSIIRPVSNSLFITKYGTQFFPYAWMISIPLNLLLVGIYNKYLPKLGCLKTYLIVASSIVAINYSCALFIKQFSFLVFFLYIWKEIYIVLMFQQLWSIIHSTVPLKRAKYLYGIFLGAGGIGSLLGSLLPGFFAVKVGSESLLYMTLPLYLCLTAAFILTLKQSNQGLSLQLEEKTGAKNALLHGVRLIINSRTLAFIALSVLFMQLSATLIDYQFSTYLEQTIVGKDLRTQYIGRVLGIGLSISVCMQFFGTYFLIQMIGIKRLHIGFPILLGSMSIFSFLFPGFAITTLVFIILKACDFSLFTIIKETLYVPLSCDEKFRAKAFIDVFLYRFAKVFASLIILSLQVILTSYLLPVLNSISICVFISWIAIAIYLFKKIATSELKDKNA
ncbi:Npt1/Npt2 family nucleotide transporter [Candidatus Rhabdochlamydia sp. T3358]|uniref:Npt1/Npt2 family nucleotide transporter n=1 Tax=Candidatus Rhabdochlamydia sp. T3358 TaxID=2099795 RepID=UPI0010B855C2|nr:Npt1/Npt2 family nucleotide transporter [Candidatus Rhabdochlamydia sp. T3358]VHO03136.1 TLC ATP/ADP transporter [Candidatus Rhabdochlamydia sp. T3358]